MSNNIKYSGGTSSNSIKSGNFNVAVNNTTTDLSGFYNGISPINGGYVIYVNKSSNGPSIYAPKNDSELISITNSLGGNVATAADALVWINSQSTMTVLNNNYPSIVTSGLVLNLDAGFVSSYPKTGTTWRDLSGNGNNGTLVNGPTYSSVDGGSIVFDGVNDYVNISSPTFNPVGVYSFTVSCWVKLNSIPSGNPRIVCQSVDNNNYYNLAAYGGGTPGTYDAFWFEVKKGGIFYGGFLTAGANKYSANVWYNIVGTFDNITNVPRFYLNATSISGSGVGGGAPSPNSSILIANNNTSSISSLPGNITQVQIYNRALSAAEVLQNYNAGLQRFIPTNGLVLSLDAQNTNLYAVSATTAYDVSGNDNNGTLLNGAQYVSNGDGSWSFDGVDDYIGNIGTTSSFSFIQNTGIFTICAWVRLTEFSTTQRAIMGNNRNVTTEKGFLLARGTASSRIRFVITNGGGNVFSQQLDNYFLDSNWVFVTIVGDGTVIVYYRNGVLFQNGGAIGTMTTGDSTRTLSVGSVTNLSSSFFWGGNISQTSIYNRALTQTEITTIYNATKSRYGL